ncbi:MAG: SUMF1/EgtB/PvdO family nonheme iron enzyme, partial [Planctomycetaceae bacterium]|nr:SUMF1/EgtB/PvdO family nonheme iron enzyme [Planctomycetaceae bacterium]
MSPNESVQFETGADGELLITLHENANPGPNGNLLNVPDLVVRAGFMPRSSRFVIHPVEHSLNTLHNITGDQLTGKAPLSRAENKKATLLQGEKAVHAEEVAKTVRHVMALAKPGKPAGLQAAGMARGRELDSGATHLNQQFAPADSVQSLHHHAHVEIHRPVSPDRMPNPSCILHLNDNGKMKYHSFASTQALNKHLAMCGVGTIDTLLASRSRLGPDDPAGGLFSGITSVASGFAHAATSLGHAIKDGAGALKDGATIVVHKVGSAASAVANTVVSAARSVAGVAISVLAKVNGVLQAVGTWVIKTVADAVNHVVDFLKSIVDKLKDLYNFLKSLFNWKQILEVHDVLKNVMAGGVKSVEHQLKSIIPRKIDEMAKSLSEKKAKLLGIAEAHSGDDSLAAKAQTPNERASATVSHTKSNKGKHLQKKVDHHSTDTGPLPNERDREVGNPQEVELPSPHPDVVGQAKKVGQDLIDIIKSFASPSHLSLAPFKHLLNDIIDLVIDVVELTALKIVDAITSVFSMLWDSLKEEISIPFLSSLYKTLTGNKLSILDVACLTLAVPVNLVMVVTGFDWSTHKEGVQNSSTGLVASAKTRHADAAGAPDGHNWSRFLSVAWGVVTVMWTGIKIAGEIVAGYASATPKEELAKNKPNAPRLNKAPEQKTLQTRGKRAAGISAIEVIFGTLAVFMLSKLRADLGDQWVSGDNIGALVGIGLAVLALGGSMYVTFVSNPVGGNIFSKLLTGGTCVMALLALVGVILAWKVDGAADQPGAFTGEFIMTCIAGVQGFLGFLSLDYPNMLSMDSNGTPWPAITLGAVDLIGSAAAIVVHNTLGLGKQLFWEEWPITNSVEMEFAPIPSGNFTMGSPAEESGRNDSPDQATTESQHDVKIAERFFLGTTEVTQGQWKKVMGDDNQPWKGRDHVEEGDDFPATWISWHEANEFCRKLNELEKKQGNKYTYRLPTEVEWEYACRANQALAYTFGDNPKDLDEYACYKEDANEDDNDRLPVEVGGKSANEFGLLDMHGNVW